MSQEQKELLLARLLEMGYITLASLLLELLCRFPLHTSTVVPLGPIAGAIVYCFFRMFLRFAGRIYYVLRLLLFLGGFYFFVCLE